MACRASLTLWGSNEPNREWNVFWGSLKCELEIHDPRDLFSLGAPIKLCQLSFNKPISFKQQSFDLLEGNRSYEYEC
jgi:hypothetical protein